MGVVRGRAGGLTYWAKSSPTLAVTTLAYRKANGSWRGVRQRSRSRARRWKVEPQSAKILTRLTDRLGRAFQRLGLQRQARELGQSDDELGGAMLADIAERRREQEAAEAIAKAAAPDEVVP
jgi:hypothetical protein